MHSERREKKNSPGRLLLSSATLWWEFLFSPRLERVRVRSCKMEVAAVRDLPTTPRGRSHGRSSLPRTRPSDKERFSLVFDLDAALRFLWLLHHWWNVTEQIYSTLNVSFINFILLLHNMSEANFSTLFCRIYDSTQLFWITHFF